MFRRLQGKTQLFPGFESDFFRNRLTHSLEVAQVAKSIAQRLNLTVEEFKEDQIDPDIVEIAGLAHDLGHPPFGHKGERALDTCMKKYGGFEGNAQTLRNLRLEKKVIRAAAGPDARECGVSLDGQDFRVGLNLTARTLAAVLKYDALIPPVREPDSKVDKGYYDCDKDLVDWIKDQILPSGFRPAAFKTVECQIMDLADDIAYSTYDLEDAFKAGFLSPLELLALDDLTLSSIADEVRPYVAGPFVDRDVLSILVECFGGILDPTEESAEAQQPPPVAQPERGAKFSELAATTDVAGARNPDEHRLRLKTAIVAYRQSVDVATNGYARNATTSKLVASAVEGVEVDYNNEYPMLSKVRLREDVLRRVETLKRVAYLAIVQSPRLRVAEHRGSQIITDIFMALTEEKGYQLLPGDYKELYHRFKSNERARYRLICDFIAGMTDAYAIEFYTRLKSADARLLHKPF